MEKATSYLEWVQKSELKYSLNSAVRGLLALGALAGLFTAAAAAFVAWGPGKPIVRDPNTFGFVGVTFGLVISIQMLVPAVSGKLISAKSKARRRSFLMTEAGRQYLSGKLTLDEFGECAKAILSDDLYLCQS